MISCKKFSGFLDAWLDDELTAEQRAAFDDHLRLCPPCLDYVESYARTVQLTRHALDDEDGDLALPGEVPEELFAAVMDALKH